MKWSLEDMGSRLSSHFWTEIPSGPALKDLLGTKHRLNNKLNYHGIQKDCYLKHPLLVKDDVFSPWPVTKIEGSFGLFLGIAVAESSDTQMLSSERSLNCPKATNSDLS